MNDTLFEVVEDRRLRPTREALLGWICTPEPPSRQLFPKRWYEWHWARGLDPDAERRKLPAKLRAAVIERDGYVCRLCGGEVAPHDVHIDHAHPRALGGQDTFDNLQVAHASCNLSKGARVWTAS